MVIGLLGESKSGKDWLSKQFIKGLNIKESDLKVIRAADILKLEAESRYPDSFNIKCWETKESEGYRDETIIINSSMTMTRRKLLQYLGDILKLEDPNYVNTYLKNSIDSSRKTYVIIPDLRNEDEVDSVLEKKGIIVKCNRKLKYRYSREWKEYKSSLDNVKDANSSGFLKFLELDYPSIHDKLNHHTETSIEEVPISKIHFNFINEPSKDFKARLESLICKLRN